MSQKLQKISDWLLLAAIFLLPWQTRYIIEAGQLNKGPYEYTTLALYGTDLLILAALFLAAVNIFLNKEKNAHWPHKNFWLLIIGLLFFTCFSIFASSDRLITLYALARLSIGVGLAWLIIYSRINYKKILAVIVMAASLQGILAVGQFIKQETLGNKWLGLAAHYPSDLGVSVVETASVPIERWLRAYGSLDHPNLLGGFLGLGLIITFYLFINLNKTKYQNCHCEPVAQRMAPARHRKRSVAGRWQSLCISIKQINYQELALSFALILITAGLFVSFSRAAILSAGLGLIILFIGHFKNWRLFLTPALIIGVTVIALIIPYGHLYRARVGVFDPATVGARLEVKSLDERSSYNRQAWELIKKHPLWGVGAGHYGLAISQEIIPQQLSYYYQPVHNVFLLVWAELGAVGLFFWVVLLVKLLLDIILSFRAKPHWTTAQGKLKNFFNTFKNLEGILHQTAAAGLVQNDKNGLALAIFILPLTIMFFDHWLWDLHFGVLFFWLIVGLVIKLSYYKNNL